MKNESYSVLLDTCSMARISLYCETCNSLNKKIGATIEEIKKEFENKNISTLIENLNYVKNGYDIYNYLKKIKNDNADTGFVLYFSQFAKIELYDIFLDISFDELLTKNGISYRLRRKKPFRWQVDFDFNEKVINRYNEIEKSLQEIDVSISIAENDPSVGHNLPFDINNILLSHVFLDSFDSYLYSLSLSLMVDEFLTSDNELKNILKDFQTNNNWSDHLKNVKESIIKISPSHKEMCIENETINIAKFHLPNITDL